MFFLLWHQGPYLPRTSLHLTTDTNPYRTHTQTLYCAFLWSQPEYVYVFLSVCVDSPIAFSFTPPDFIEQIMK